VVCRPPAATGLCLVTLAGEIWTLDVADSSFEDDDD
jgi:hypothetical protein